MPQRVVVKIKLIYIYIHTKRLHSVWYTSGGQSMLATIYLFTFSAESTIMINGVMSPSDYISIILRDVPLAFQIQRDHHWPTSLEVASSECP